MQAFPGPGAKFQISTEGGDAPVWRPGRQESCFFFPRTITSWRVPIQTSPTFEAGTPRALFPESLKLERFASRRMASASSSAFPLPRAADEAASGSSLNWPAELK